MGSIDRNRARTGQLACRLAWGRSDESHSFAWCEAPPPRCRDPLDRRLPREPVPWQLPAGHGVDRSESFSPRGATRWDGISAKTGPSPAASRRGAMPMTEMPIKLGRERSADGLVRVGTLADLQARGMVVVRGARCPLLVVHDRGRVFALDNRCPHLGFPLHRGSVEDG